MSEDFAEKILPKGTYPAKAAGPAVFRKSGDWDVVTVKFQLTGEHSDVTVYWDGFVDERSKPENIDRTMDSLRYMGWKSDNVLDVMLPDVLTDGVELVIEPKEYNGRRSNRVVFVNQPGLGKIKGALDQTAAKLLAARLKAKAVESRTRLGTPKVTTGAGLAAAHEAAQAKARLEAAKAAAVKAALAAFPDAEVERDWSDEIDPADRDAF